MIFRIIQSAKELAAVKDLLREYRLEFEALTEKEEGIWLGIVRQAEAARMKELEETLEQNI